MSQQYIQCLAQRLLTKYRHEVQQSPGYGPSERLFEAANALNRMVNEHETSNPTILGAIIKAKDHGTAGYEMWAAGQVWIQHYHD